MDEFQSEVLQRLTAIETKLSNGITAKQKDHEERLRDLETYKWKLVGALTLLQAVGFAAIKLLFN